MERIEQDEAGAAVTAVEVGGAVGVEDAQGVAELVIGEGEDGLVHNYDGKLGIGSGLAGGVGEAQGEASFCAGFDFGGVGEDGDGQAALQGGDVESEFAPGVGGARGRAVHRLALVVETRRRADDIHLQVEVGDVFFLNRQAEGGGGGFEAEALRGQDTAAVDGEEAFGGGKGRLHQDLGDIARLVGLFVGDEGEGFLFDAAGGLHLAAADPAGELALILAAQVVNDDGGDAVAAADGRLEGASDRLQSRTHLAGLDIRFFLAPASAAGHPLHAGGAHFDRPVGDGSAVNIGDDQLNLERRTALDKVALAAQANVEAGGMHQQRGRTAPRLAVDIHDGGAGDDADRLAAGVVGGIEIEAQIVDTGGVGLAAEGFGRPIAAPTRTPAVVKPPPGLPGSEGEIRPIGRAVAGVGGGDLPGDISAGQGAAGVILRLDGQDGHRTSGVRARAGAGKVGAGRFAAGRDLKLRAAKLLDLKAVVELRGVQVAGDADGPQRHLRVAQVDGLRQLDDEVEAAQGVDLRLAAGDLAALGVSNLVGDGADGCAYEVNAAVRAAANPPQPAFEVDFFAGFVHLAVVEDVPLEGVAGGPGVPGVVAPVVGRAGEEGLVSAAPGGEVCRAGGDGEAGDAVRIGEEGLAAGFGEDGDAGQGGAVLQAGGPGDKLLVVAEGVQADVGDLNPGVDGLGQAAPFLLVVFKEAFGRFDDDNKVAELSVEVLAEVNVYLGQGVSGQFEGDGAVFDQAAGELRSGVVLLPVAQVLFEGRPVGGLDGVDFEVQFAVVDGVDGEDGFGGRWVEGDEDIPRPAQERFGFAYFEAQDGFLAQFLFKDVLQFAGDRYLVGGLALGRAADFDGAAVDVDDYAGDGGFDTQHVFGVGVGVYGVVEADVEGGQGGALFVPRAAVVFNAQRRIGEEAKGLRLRGQARPFRRGRSRADGHCHAGVRRQGFERPKCQPTPLRSAFHRLADVAVLLNLRLAGQRQRHPLPAGRHLDRLQHRRRVNPLIKGNEKDRIERLGAVCRIHPHRLRRGRAECPFDRLGQHPTHRRLHTGRDGDMKIRRFRQAIHRHFARRGVILKGQGLCPQPAPGPRQRRLDAHRHILRRQVGQSSQSDHRLVKSNAQEGRQRNLAFGRIAQHLKRPGLALFRRGQALRLREGLLDGFAAARGRDGLLRQPEGRLLGGNRGQRRQAGEKLIHLLWRQWFAGRRREASRRLHRLRLSLAEANGEARRGLLG